MTCSGTENNDLNQGEMGETGDHRNRRYGTPRQLVLGVYQVFGGVAGKPRQMRGKEAALIRRRGQKNLAQETETAARDIGLDGKG